MYSISRSAFGSAHVFLGFQHDGRAWGRVERSQQCATNRLCCLGCKLLCKPPSWLHREPVCACVAIHLWCSKNSTRLSCVDVLKKERKKERKEREKRKRKERRREGGRKKRRRGKKKEEKGREGRKEGRKRREDGRRKEGRKQDYFL
ncbi:priB, partial [Ophiophagus hannah]